MQDAADFSAAVGDAPGNAFGVLSIVADAMVLL